MNADFALSKCSIENVRHFEILLDKLGTVRCLHSSPGIPVHTMSSLISSSAVRVSKVSTLFLVNDIASVSALVGMDRMFCMGAVRWVFDTDVVHQQA